jgi:hypothetical protein
VEHFAAFEDDALNGRLQRQKRAEQDLVQRIATRISQVDAEGGWLRSDPLYQRLALALSKVREDLQLTQDEVSRRSGAPNVHENA